MFGLGNAWHRVYINLESSLANASSHLCVKTKVTDALLRYMAGLSGLSMVAGKCSDLHGKYIHMLYSLKFHHSF